MSQTVKNTTFQKYTTYMDIGVKWLGVISKYWDAIRMKFPFRDVFGNSALY